MPPDTSRFKAPSVGELFFPLSAPSRYAADYRYLVAYEIIAQGWKKRLGVEGVVVGVNFKNCYRRGWLQFSHVIIIKRAIPATCRHTCCPVSRLVLACVTGVERVYWLGRPESVIASKISTRHTS